MRVIGFSRKRMPGGARGGHRKWQLPVLCLLFLLGLLLGVETVSDHGAFLAVQRLFLANVNLSQHTSFGGAFLSSFLSVLPLTLIAFAAGLCAFGAPAAVILPLFRGLGLGLAAGYVYAQYGGNGILYAGVFIIPFGFLSTWILILICRDALRLSVNILAVVAAGVRASPSDPFTHYLRRCIVLHVFLGLAAVVNALLITTLIHFFQFI